MIIKLTMTTWTSVLFVLSSVLSPTLCCHWIKHFGRLSGESLRLIEHMGGPLTDQQSSVPFPDSLYNDTRKAEVKTQLVFIRDTLKQISKVYQSENITSVTWNTREMENFQQIINRQTEELNSCVSANRRPKAARKLRNYFRRLKRCSLESGGGSAACWEIIRKATTMHLEQLDLLMNKIKAADAASRGRSTPN